MRGMHHLRRSIMLATLPLGLASAAWAGADVNMQTFQAVTEAMPAGSHAAPLSEADARSIPRPRIPGKAEKAAPSAKSAPLTAADQAAPLVEAAPTPEAVIPPVCNTNSTTGFTPSDIHGSTGPTNIVVVTNVNVSIRNKTTCGLVSNQSLIGFFASTGVPAGTTIFDPRTLYDTLSGRFFVTAESLNDTNNDQFQYLAVSTDNTGTAWHKYRIKLSQGLTKFCKNTVDSFWDYPQAGVNNTRWFISANDFHADNSVSGALLSIDKAPTLTGGAVSVRCFVNLPFNLAVPVVKTTGAKAVMLSPGSGSGNAIQRRDYNTTATLASDTLLTRPSFAITAWSAPPNAEMTNGNFLDSLEGRFQSQSVQIGTVLWNVHAIDRAGKSAVRAYRLSASSNVASTVLSSATLCGTPGCTDHAFNPSIDSAGTTATSRLFITLSRTIPTSTTNAGKPNFLIFRGVATLGGAFTSNVIKPSTDEYTNCGFTANSPCRWGDYSSTQIDPSDATVGWGFNQIINGPSQFTNWTTRAGRVN